MRHGKILDELARLVSEIQTATEAISGAKLILENIMDQTVAEEQKPAVDLDIESFFMNEIIGSEDISKTLGMTQTNVSLLFNRGMLNPSRKIGRDWITTKSAVQRYKDNYVERRGNPWFGTVYKGRRPKEVETAHEETAQT
jgi:hypothetical protein